MPIAQRLVLLTINDKALLFLKTDQQDSGRIDPDLLLEVVIETLGPHTVVHPKDQMMISSGNFSAVKHIYPTIPEQTRGGQ